MLRFDGDALCKVVHKAMTLLLNCAYKCVSAQKALSAAVVHAQSSPSLPRETPPKAPSVVVAVDANALLECAADCGSLAVPPLMFQRNGAHAGCDFTLVEADAEVDQFDFYAASMGLPLTSPVSQGHGGGQSTSTSWPNVAAALGVDSGSSALSGGVQLGDLCIDSAVQLARFAHSWLREPPSGLPASRKQLQHVQSALESLTCSPSRPSAHQADAFQRGAMHERRLCSAFGRRMAVSGALAVTHQGRLGGAGTALVTQPCGKVRAWLARDPAIWVGALAIASRHAGQHSALGAAATALEGRWSTFLHGVLACPGNRQLVSTGAWAFGHALRPNSVSSLAQY